MTNDELVKRLREAVPHFWHTGDGLSKCGVVLSKEVCDQIAAALERAVPEGYVLVPVKPTVAMLKNAQEPHDIGLPRLTEIYRAFLAARPQGKD